MNPIVLIPARLNATRLPGKPLADIGGKPMIVRVLERALEAAIGPVWVACDAAETAWAVEMAGGRAIMTSESHPSGSDRIYEALSQVDPDGNHDVVVNLQGDMPTIEPETIRAALSLLDDPNVDIATLAAAIRTKKEANDPAVVKPVISFYAEKRGRALYFSRERVPHGAKHYFHHIGIYAYRRKALEAFVKLPPSPLEIAERLEQLRALEAGMHIDVALCDAVPLGVDTPEHLETARRIYAKL